MKDDPFISPTLGALGYERMMNDILGFIRQDPLARYRLIIGTDSHVRDDLCFVTAVIIHREGKGARYYYRKRHQRKLSSLRQKIFYETALSLTMASRVAETLEAAGESKLNVEIHLDVGEHGDTRDLIREVVGMVTGSGFSAAIKPNSFGASKVADRYTK